MKDSDKYLTKDDLDKFRLEIRKDFDESITKAVDDLSEQLRDITEILQKEISSVNNRLNNEVKDIRKEMKKRNDMDEKRLNWHAARLDRLEAAAN